MLLKGYVAIPWENNRTVLLEEMENYKTVRAATRLNAETSSPSSPPPPQPMVSCQKIFWSSAFFRMHDNLQQNILAPKAVLKTITLGYRHSLLQIQQHINIFYGHFYIILINKGNVNLNAMTKKKTCTTLYWIV